MMAGTCARQTFARASIASRRVTPRAFSTAPGTHPNGCDGAAFAPVAPGRRVCDAVVRGSVNRPATAGNAPELTAVPKQGCRLLRRRSRHPTGGACGSSSPGAGQVEHDPGGGALVALVTDSFARSPIWADG